ncbi:MAG TPA: hypothetical protein VHN99_01075 [Deinococcales bacterium]|nr:hypothetical protein [Deinococcales bacterium]
MEDGPELLQEGTLFSRRINFQLFPVTVRVVNLRPSDRATSSDADAERAPTRAELDGVEEADRYARAHPEAGTDMTGAQLLSVILDKAAGDFILTYKLKNGLDWPESGRRFELYADFTEPRWSRISDGL